MSNKYFFWTTKGEHIINTLAPGLTPLVGLFLAWGLNLRLTQRRGTTIHPFADAEWFTGGILKSTEKEKGGQITGTKHFNPCKPGDTRERCKKIERIKRHRIIIIILLVFMLLFSVTLDACRSNCKIKLDATTNKTEIAKLEKLQKALDIIFYCFCAICGLLPIAWFFLFRFLNYARDFYQISFTLAHDSEGKTTNETETLITDTKDRGKERACGVARKANILLALCLVAPIGVIIWQIVENFNEITSLIDAALYVPLLIGVAVIVIWLGILQGLFHVWRMCGFEVITNMCNNPPQTGNPPVKKFNMNDPAVYLMQSVL